MEEAVSLPVGTRVSYREMSPLDRITGTVATPTSDELRYAREQRYASQGVGPDHGDVVVRWDGDEDWDRSWENPRDLVVLNSSPTR